MEMRLIADMVYNANVPFTTGRLSFVPSELPDPSCLPGAIFRSVQAVPVGEQRRREAGQEAFTRSLELLQEKQSFFHRIQEQCLVPDYAELTVANVLEIQQWDEWNSYRQTQADFFNSETLRDMLSRVEDYYKTVVELHQKLDRHCSQKRWKLIRNHALKLSELAKVI